MTLSDSINRSIEIALTGAKITSASPGHVNSVFLLEEMDHTDFESEVRGIIAEEVNLLEIEALRAPDELAGGDNGTPSALEKEINTQNVPA